MRYTPDDVAALVAATRRQVHNIEHWLDSGQAAGPKESKSIYRQMKDALEPFKDIE